MARTKRQTKLTLKHATRRMQDGNQLAEFGPGLALLFLSAFIPLVLLIAVAVNYGAAYTLNNLQVREAVVSKRSEVESATGNVKKLIPERWKAAGFGQFANLSQDPSTEVSYKEGLTDSEGRKDMIVRVITTVKPKPLLPNMPFIAGIPGLTSEAVFIFDNQAVIENPDDGQPGA
ncbi:MAG: hypothetical protein SGJ27_15465 [Candidatus Melainabacteria bacterium]|nr:hypothetical protein [Candidatus Melainabacteria bacterium]